MGDVEPFWLIPARLHCRVVNLCSHSYGILRFGMSQVIPDLGGALSSFLGDPPWHAVPLGIAALEVQAPQLIPWAWG